MIPYTDFFVSKVGLSSYSAQLRFSGWRESAYLLADSPITGAGLAGFQTAVLRYHTTSFFEVFLYPHNVFLNFWVELGIVGLLLFFVFMYATLKQSHHLLTTTSSYKKALVLAGTTSLIIMLVHGMVDVPFFKNDLAIIFLVIWVWPFLIERIREKGGRL